MMMFGWQCDFVVEHYSFFGRLKLEPYGLLMWMN